MITEFLAPQHAGMDPATAAILKGAGKEASSLLLKYTMGDMAIDKLSGEMDHKARIRELSKLDILMKKRQLGIPYTDDDLEGTRKSTYLTKSKEPSLAVIIQQARPHVFESLLPTMGQGIPSIMPFPPSGGGAVLPFPMKAAETSINVLKLPKKGGLVASLMKALK